MQERESLRRKRASRVAAIQGIYSLAISGAKLSTAALQSNLTLQWQDSLNVKEAEWPAEDMPEQALLTELLSGVMDQDEKIRALVQETLKENWKPERMDPVMFAILRCAAFELSFLPDHHTAMINDEYVSIAGMFLSEAEQAFVHSAILQMAAMARPQNTSPIHD